MINERYIGRVVLLVACASALVGGISCSSSAARGKGPILSTLGGELQRPLEGSGARVFVFILPDCPISSAYAPEIQRIERDYASRGVKTYLVHVDAHATGEELRKHAEEFGYRMPILVDRKRELARQFGVSVAPEAVLIDGHGRVAYQGRIDDLYTEWGKRRKEPTRRDLREAIEAVLSGKTVEIVRTQAVGCSI